jgi:hypothetical protein
MTKTRRDWLRKYGNSSYRNFLNEAKRTHLQWNHPASDNPFRTRTILPVTPHTFPPGRRALRDAIYGCHRQVCCSSYGVSPSNPEGYVTLRVLRPQR